VTPNRKGYELRTIEHGYTPFELRKITSQTNLVRSDNLVSRPRWGDLMTEVFGTVNKTFSE